MGQNPEEQDQADEGEGGDEVRELTVEPDDMPDGPPADDVLAAAEAAGAAAAEGLVEGGEPAAPAEPPEGDAEDPNPGKVFRIATADEEDAAEDIPLSQIDRLPANPRGEPKDVPGLAKTIREIGWFGAIMVRPNAGRYQVVYGWRRFLARDLNAKDFGGPKTIRAVIRILDDAQADKLCLAENLNRVDLSPLEEGAAYLRLKEVHGMTPEAIGEMFGRQRRHVYNRIQLLKLGDGARKALDTGEVNASVALEISKRPTHAIQEQMVARLKALSITTYAAALELFRTEFAYDLKEAPFDRKDPFLVPEAFPEAVPCEGCPFNTRNQKQLELGEKPPPSADVCTNPPCFAAKTACHVAQEKKKADEAGKKWLSQADTKRVFQGGLEVAAGAPYVDLKAPCYEHKTKAQWKKLVGDEPLKVYVAVDPKGRVHELVDRAEAVAAARKLGTLGEAAAEQAARDPSAEKKERREEDNIQEAAARKILLAGVKQAEDVGLDVGMLRVMVLALLESTVTRPELEERRGHSLEQLATDVPKMKEPALRGLLLELVLGEYAESMTGEMLELAKALKIQPKKVEKEAKAERQAALGLEAQKKQEAKDAKAKKTKAA